MSAQGLKKSGVFVGRTVLLVEDEKITRDMLRGLLEQLGFGRVDEAADGSAALKKLDDNRYDLILCDIMMEPMDGIEFARMLRNSGNLRFDTHKTRTKIVFLTASGEKANIQAARGLKVQGYMLKPVDPKVLREKLLKVFGG